MLSALHTGAFLPFDSTDCKATTHIKDSLGKNPRTTTVAISALLKSVSLKLLNLYNQF